MNRISRRGLPKLRGLAVREGDPNEMLDILLALDQALVEFSMSIYKVSRRERLRMRNQNRRLHDVVRKHLPRLLEPSRNQS